MTRKLPWTQSSRTKTSSRLPPMSVATPRKHSERNETPSSSAKITDIEMTPRRKRPRSPASSSMAPSSPLAEPVEEVFMQEGIDKDDRYRMVEDELLRVAKQFTVHLHAAEYKRRQKMERERNSDMINSISRPVVGRIPDHTKRKADRVDTARRQQTTIDAVLTRDGKQDDDSDDSAEGLPYIGTSLHGLMDSPRKKSKSLAKLGMISTTTRASAGFDRGSSKRPNSRGSIFSQSQRKSQDSQTSVVKASGAIDESETASSDEDDDLDAPVAAPKPLIQEQLSSALSKSQPPILTQSRTAALPNGGTLRSLHQPNQSNSRVAERVERIRLQRAKKEEDNSKIKQKIDIIPTFL